MSVELSGSSDSDIFEIQQTERINRLTQKQFNKNEFKQDQKSKNKKEKIRKRSTDSEERKSRKKIYTSTEKLISTTKSSNKSDGNFNKRSLASENIKNATSSKENKKDVCSPQSFKSPNANILKYFSPTKLSSSSDSSFNINDKLELSPGVSRNRKKFLITKTSHKSKKNVCKPLIKMFDILNKNDNSEKKESSHKVVSEIIENIPIKDKIELTKGFDKAKNNTVENKIDIEEFLPLEDFQNNFDGMDPFEVVKKEKFNDNSESLSFISDFYFKKIITDVIETQTELSELSFKKGKKVEKLYSESEYEILRKFLNLEEGACKLFVKMLGKKKSWHRVCSINYPDIGSNLVNEFKTLSEENYIDVNIENEKITTQMNLLKKTEVSKLCKDFNVSLKKLSATKKEDLINTIIKEAKSQRSAMEMFKTNNINRFDLLKSEVTNILGMCVRLNNRIFQIFYKILLLFSYAHYFGEEEKRFNTEIFRCYQVHNNMIRYPSYKLSSTVVFETQADFDEYKKALLILDCFEAAIFNKNYDEFVYLFFEAKKEFVKLLENLDYLNRLENLQPFLKKFSAGTVYAKILTMYCTKFKKMTNKAEVLNIIQLLLNQNSFLTRKKGEWYEILSRTLEMQKKNKAAAEVIIKALKDPLVNEVQKLTLQLRGQFILKKKSNGINNVELKKTLCDVCTPTIEEPPCIEIKGKVLDGNVKGFKSVYIQETQNGNKYMSVEERAISHYKLMGFTKGYHVEGGLIQSIYFLLFFDIIYKLSPEGVFQSPYQVVPLDFYSSSFYSNRKEEIDLLLSEMLEWDNEEVEAKIKDAYYKNCNTECIINWSEGLTPELFYEVIRCITMPILVLIFQRFVRNFRQVRAGFPDLTLLNPETNKCKFVEVKSPNDRLSSAQRLWLDFLRKIGLDCEVCNIKNSNKRSE